MRIFTTLLLLTCSVFVFGKSISVDTTFSISTFNSTLVCGNDSVNIIATGCSGNVIWNKGNTYNPFAIHAVESGDYFATCAPTGEVSNIITLTFLPTLDPPTITSEYINSQLTFNASGCAAEVVWQDGSVGTSIIAVLRGEYFAFCRGAIDTICSSRASNIITVISPFPTISANQTKLCNGERALLSATDCAGTISWSNGLTGTTISISAAGSYNAYCIKNGIQSPPSNTIEITAIDIVTPTIYSIDNIYCLNPTVTLTTRACSDGNLIWSNGTTAASITVSAAGTYSAQCQNQCGLSTSSNIVTVLENSGTIAVPSAPFISTTRMNICNGESVVLTATGCNETIVWNNGTTSSAITISQIGTYSAQCQNQCSKSNQSNAITIQQGYPPAAPLIGANKNVLCDDESATLFATGCQGQIVWSTGVTTTYTQLFTSGTYSATCRNQCGESGPSNSIILRRGISPTTPTATSNKTSICSGETANLIANGCNGVVIWSNAMTSTSIQISQVGTYTVTCNTICGSAVSNSVVIGANNTSQAPSITSSKTVLCGTENATLTATGCTSNVVWSNGSTGTTITVAKEGTYSAKCQTSCGLSGDSNSIKIVQLNNQCTPITIRKLR